jgi:hypothetical protein
VDFGGFSGDIRYRQIDIVNSSSGEAANPGPFLCSRQHLAQSPRSSPPLQQQQPINHRSPPRDGGVIIKEGRPINQKTRRTAMNTTLLNALIVLIPVGPLFLWSAVMLFRRGTVWHLLQLLGAGCLVVVVLVHIFEALDLFPSMQWGSPHSVGHYLDFVSAILGIGLFLIGYIFSVLNKKKLDN